MNNIPKEILARQEQLRQAKADIEIDRRELLGIATRTNIGVVHVFDQAQAKGGLTIAFRKSMPNQTSTNMVEVAVATCSYMDTFSRKIGTQLALSAFVDGLTILLPLSSGYADEDLAGRVKRAFTALYTTQLNG